MSSTKQAEYMWLNPLNKLNPNCIYCYQLKTACKSQTDVVSVLYFQHTQPNGCRKGVPGHAWCIDCMHWRWKNCPEAWHGQFTGHCHDPTIILDAVASQDLWIWHAYFGLPGSHNDLNVLQRSHLFARLAAGDAPPVNFEVNGHHHTMGYYLADGIYPSWSTFVKTIRNPQGNKRAHFAQV